MSSAVLASVESDFLAAREAYAKGQSARLAQLAPRIPARHLLRPYVDYWLLKRSGASPEVLARFAVENADTPLAESVRKDLVRLYAKAGDSAPLRFWYAQLTRPDTELQCLVLDDRLSRGEPGAASEAAALYPSARSLPASCGSLFARLFQQGVLGVGDRLARLRLALDTGNLPLADALLQDLSAGMAIDAGLLKRAQKSPAAVLNGPFASPAERELGLYALSRLASDDPAATAARWETARGAFSEAEQRYGWGQVARQGARRLSPAALGWYARAGSDLTAAQRAWKVRSLLRAGRWLEVYQTIEGMTPAERDQPTWQYWRARALKALNATVVANQLFARLSQAHDYYGLLAAEELPVRLENRQADYRLGYAELQAAQGHPGLQRALALRALDLPGDAAAEWEWALRRFDDRQLLAAAELARRDGWYDRAISTAEKTRELHNFDLRYLTPFRDLAERYAGDNGLDPAWVYGLMRQESRFVDYARSGVGARGLMQIMPATAKWIARQLGLGRHAHAGVDEPETNIRFGTYYLRHIQDSLGGSPVLATAGYNAGPGRARRWQAETPLEGAIYVDTIPFQETREYVRKVLANAMYYRQRLGLEPGNLRDRLGIIPGRASSASADTGNVAD